MSCSHVSACARLPLVFLQVNLTLYHQDQATVAPGIENKDTADAPGDTYFVLKDVGLAHECRENPRAFDCQNPEVRMKKYHPPVDITRHSANP
jgi:hypothetical protein